MRPIIASLLLSSCAFADRWTDQFTFESIDSPVGVDPQFGGLASLPDGRLVAAFHRGEIMFYDPDKKIWTEFARGLHEPLGLLVEDEKNILVMQRPELTRLTDTDGDGVADEYTTVFDDFGMTGNYHEFAFGPARDAEGNLYISLGIASNGAGVREEIRGEWNEIGHPREKMLQNENWKQNKTAAGRMYSRAAWRGWVIKITPDGKGTPFASGLRSPNGIIVDSEGRLLVCDNQGDWLGTSKLHHIRKDHFHGHPASLIWKEGWTKDPLKMNSKEFDQIRTRAAGLFPQAELANSPTQPVIVSPKAFPTIANETLIGDMNQTTLVRFLPDSGVKGASQGATIPFLQSETLGRGNNRLAFTADGSLWVGKTQLSWPGSQGLLRIRKKQPAEKPLFVIKEISLKGEGFQIHFSKPVEPESLKAISLTRHTYNYHVKYGSEKVDEVLVKTVETLSADRKTLTFKTSDLREDYLYTIDLGETISEDQQPILGQKAYYHLIAKK